MLGVNLGGEFEKGTCGGVESVGIGAKLDFDGAPGTAPEMNDSVALTTRAIAIIEDSAI